MDIKEVSNSKCDKTIQNNIHGDSPVADFSDEVIQNLGVYVCVVDKDVVVLRTNFYNITHEQLPDKPLRLGNVIHCINGEDAGRCGDGEKCKTCPVRHAITEAFRKHCGFRDIQAPMRLYKSSSHDDVIDCYVNVSARYLQGKGKDVMVLTIQDITKDKKNEEELKKARQKAEQADIQKSVFVANMSHEMRTPLNAILGFSELLVSETDEKKKMDYLNIIRINNELLLCLVNDILDISRIEAGTIAFEYSDFDFNLLMREQESIFRLRVEAMCIPVQVHFIPGQASCHIHTEHKRVQQVISNLLGNAIKNTTSGSITFGYEVHDNEIYCYVTDTGQGIPDDKQKEIFERFSKLDQNKQGAGLGLAISRMIIEKLGGRIGVTSKVGIGSTFWFTLPILPLEHVNESGMGFDSVDVTKSTGKKILLFETDDGKYGELCGMLTPVFEVNRAVTAEEAINGFLKGLADGLLFEWQGGKLNCIECVAAIRQLSAEVPIIAVGDDTDSDKKKCIENGFNFYMPYCKLDKKTLCSVFSALMK